MFIRYDMIHERDRQTDGHRMTAQTVLCIASHGKTSLQKLQSLPTQYKLHVANELPYK